METFMKSVGWCDFRQALRPSQVIWLERTGFLNLFLARLQLLNPFLQLGNLLVDLAQLGLCGSIGQIARTQLFLDEPLQLTLQNLHVGVTPNLTLPVLKLSRLNTLNDEFPVDTVFLNRGLT